MPDRRICRVQQKNGGKGCDAPLDRCLSFSIQSSTPGPYDITQEKALAVLDRADEIGLVHMVSNLVEGVSYVCNCCGCCCAILRGINEWGIAESAANANYIARIDPDTCAGCETCHERCQVNAIMGTNGNASVIEDTCIGCGLCVTACPSGAATLQRKSDDEIVHPPHDYAAWENERLANRNA